MPTFLLQLKADLENISKLEVPLGYRFCIDVSVVLSKSCPTHGLGVSIVTAVTF